MPERARGVISLQRGGCWRAGPRREEVSGGTKGWPATVGGVRYFCSPCPRPQGAKRGRGGAGAALPALSYCVYTPRVPTRTVQPCCPASQGGIWGHGRGGEGMEKDKGLQGSSSSPPQCVDPMERCLQTPGARIRPLPNDTQADTTTDTGTGNP